MNSPPRCGSSWHQDGYIVSLTSCVGATTLKAKIADRMPQGVVYTTFHHPATGANVITTENSDWATNCPEYKVTAVQVTVSNHPSEWQEEWEEREIENKRISKERDWSRRNNLARQPSYSLDDPGPLMSSILVDSPHRCPSRNVRSAMISVPGVLDHYTPPGHAHECVPCHQVRGHLAGC